MGTGSTVGKILHSLAAIKKIYFSFNMLKQKKYSLLCLMLPFTVSSVLSKVCKYRGVNREKNELNAATWFTQPGMYFFV